MSQQDTEKIVLKQNEFPDFNPVQKAVLKKKWREHNLVVSAPTASGKTVIAELLALESILNRKRKVIYTCPLRALASEHYGEFKRKYSESQKIRVALSTGDFDSTSKYLDRYDIIFTTYEKLDSLVRHRADWLRSIGLLVIDEIHEIDSDRGPTLEMIATKLQLIAPRAQILALSATIPNCKDLAQWLKADLVESDFRPVKLDEGVFFDGEIKFNKRMEGISGDGEPLHDLLNDTLHQKGKQLLVFANTRKQSIAIAKKFSHLTEKALNAREKLFLEKHAEKILNTLEQPTEQCAMLAETVKKGIAFHNAGLLQKQRTIVEGLFKSNHLKAISATPTLAAGVNLPAFRVIIPSLYRYAEFGSARIPVREYKQWCFPFESKLFTREHGFLEIGKIVEDNITCNVLSFDLKHSKVEFKPVVKFFKRKSPGLMNVFLNTGNHLKVTPNHELLTSQNGLLRLKRAEDLSVGDLLVRQKCLPIIFPKPPFFFELLPVEGTFVVGCGNLFLEATRKIGLTERELARKLGINHKRVYHIKKNKKAMSLKLFLALADLMGFSAEKKALLTRKVKTAYGNVITIPYRLNLDFLWLAGFIATDGNVNYSTKKSDASEYAKIRLFNKNLKLIRNAKRIMHSFGLFPNQTSRPDGFTTLEVGATLLAIVLKKHFGLKFGNKTYSVEVPKFLSGADPRLVGAYLGGVFDGDGNYCKTSQKRGKDSNTHRVLFATGSKKFAFGIQSLLLGLGIVASVEKHSNNVTNLIRGKKVHFSKPVYYIIFRKIEYLKKFAKYAKIYKAKIGVSYSRYHNINKRDKTGEPLERVKISSIKRSALEEKVYNVQVKDNENYFCENILVHNCGRAGRPAFDDRGESVIIAHSEIEAEELMEDYVNGELEPIESKLGSEPVLRMHLLASIATGFVFDLKSLEDFFSKTFYFFQFRHSAAFSEKMFSCLEQLQEWGFVKSDEKRIEATQLGRRVSELYLDPASAFAMIQGLKSKAKRSELFYLFLFANTLELYPLISVPKKKESALWLELREKGERKELPIDLDREMFSDVDLLKKFHTALLLQSWIEEVPEQALLKDFNALPGVLHSKLQICDWLCYAAFELASLLELHEHAAPLNELRKRLKHGIHSELIGLCELKGIGRVRSRRLWQNNVRAIVDLKAVQLKRLADIIGSNQVAVSVKKQLGIEPMQKELDELKGKRQSELKEF